MKLAAGKVLLLDFRKTSAKAKISNPRFDLHHPCLSWRLRLRLSGIDEYWVYVYKQVSDTNGPKGNLPFYTERRLI